MKNFFQYQNLKGLANIWAGGIPNTRGRYRSPKWHVKNYFRLQICKDADDQAPPIFLWWYYKIEKDPFLIILQFLEKRFHALKCL